MLHGRYSVLGVIGSRHPASTFLHPVRNQSIGGEHEVFAMLLYQLGMHLLFRVSRLGILQVRVRELVCEPRAVEEVGQEAWIHKAEAQREPEQYHRPVHGLPFLGKCMKELCQDWMLCVAWDGSKVWMCSGCSAMQHWLISDCSRVHNYELEIVYYFASSLALTRAHERARYGEQALQILSLQLFHQLHV
jgi:hypothetical protein